MKKYKRICIIGYKCTGKSYVANLLGDKLGWKVYHMDKVIQREEDKSLKVLTKNGTNWTYFRNKEYEKLKTLLQEDEVIIDCNEGVPVNEVNLNDEFKLLVNSKSTLKVWVRANKVIMANKFRRKLEKIKRTKRITKEELYKYLKVEYATMDKYNDIYENLADVVVKFSEFTDITKVLTMMNIQVISVNN